MSDKDNHAQAVTEYSDPGIQERHGIIPTWLGIVYAVMFVFMVYYTIMYWTDKG